MVEFVNEIACGGNLEICDAPGELEAQLGPIEEMWTPDVALPRSDEQEGE